jgi:hypothetical protein
VPDSTTAHSSGTTGPVGGTEASGLGDGGGTAEPASTALPASGLCTGFIGVSIGSGDGWVGVGWLGATTAATRQLPSGLQTEHPVTSGGHSNCRPAMSKSSEHAHNAHAIKGSRPRPVPIRECLDDWKMARREERVLDFEITTSFQRTASPHDINSADGSHDGAVRAINS